MDTNKEYVFSRGEELLYNGELVYVVEQREIYTLIEYKSSTLGWSRSTPIPDDYTSKGCNRYYAVYPDNYTKLIRSGNQLPYLYPEGTLCKYLDYDAYYICSFSDTQSLIELVNNNISSCSINSFDCAKHYKPRGSEQVWTVDNKYLSKIDQSVPEPVIKSLIKSNGNIYEPGDPISYIGLDCFYVKHQENGFHLVEHVNPRKGWRRDNDIPSNYISRGSNTYNGAAATSELSRRVINTKEQEYLENNTSTPDYKVGLWYKNKGGNYAKFVKLDNNHFYHSESIELTRSIKYKKEDCYWIFSGFSPYPISLSEIEQYLPKLATQAECEPIKNLYKKDEWIVMIKDYCELKVGQVYKIIEGQEDNTNTWVTVDHNFNNTSLCSFLKPYLHCIRRATYAEQVQETRARLYESSKSAVTTLENTGFIITQDFDSSIGKYVPPPDGGMIEQILPEPLTMRKKNTKPKLTIEKQQ